MVNPGHIRKLRVQGTKKDLMQDISSEESMLQRWFQETHSCFWDQKPKKDSEDIGTLMGDYLTSYGMLISMGHVLMQQSIVNKYGMLDDSPLMEPQSCQCYYCAVTIGDDAVILAFRYSGIYSSATMEGFFCIYGFEFLEKQKLRFPF
ncbi:hypothetical protein QUC31_002247, partial [Theobroma cacao]